MATILIPTPLRKFAGNERSFTAEGATVGEVFSRLSESYPDIRKHLFEEDGKLRSFVRVFVGDTDIKALKESHTPVDTQAVISIVPAIAGG